MSPKATISDVTLHRFPQFFPILTAWYVLVAVAIPANCDYLDDSVSGCSSKCAVTKDKCFIPESSTS
ncbi:hypothetical protein NECAME_01153 [Necator americanus]|uniref:Uncharacterized protein n=1 Tax=Necator americanus TaxID=51031 RepID=W2SHK6_NECAM|nr:hypothetical protein NECAME_01153 [Necator americanus]ETN69043.1 hypothetical protein NECAME_01153 [Necator americanus]